MRDSLSALTLGFTVFAVAMTVQNLIGTWVRHVDDIQIGTFLVCHQRTKTNKNNNKTAPISSLFIGRNFFQN